MKKYVSYLVIIAGICLFTSNINAQVIQHQADKWQLTNGVRLLPAKQKKNLIKIEATKSSPSINSKNAADIPKKKGKNLKPPKVLKYGNKKSSNSIKKEDEE
jgi:hypothetical protein